MGQNSLDPVTSVRRDQLNREVAARIKMFRKERGMSLTSMSLRMGYKSDSTMGKVENGHLRITVALLVDLCRVLDVTPDQLLGRFNKEGREPARQDS